MASDSRIDSAFPELAFRIANQFRVMTCRNQRASEAEHLGLAAAETEFGIDAGDAQRSRGNGGDRVAESDLLTFFVSASRIRNRDLVDSPSRARGLGGYLRLEGKTIG